MKDSFMLYANALDVLDLLTDEQCGQLFRAIRDYVVGKELQELDQATRIAFCSIKNQLDRDREKYEAICEKNKESGRRGGRPKKADGFSENPNKPNGFFENPTKPKKAQTDTDTDTDSIYRGKRFVPPTLQQVKDYCSERHNSVDPEQFINFYESKNWMVGKNKMRDWKASVRTWEKRAAPNKNPFNRIETNTYDFDDLERRLLGE